MDSGIYRHMGWEESQNINYLQMKTQCKKSKTSNPKV